MVHMDFAESYTCLTAEEIQSTFWTLPQQVTLHPVVIYYNDQGEICIVVVSIELQYNREQYNLRHHKINARHQNIPIIVN